MIRFFTFWPGLSLPVRLGNSAFTSTVLGELLAEAEPARK